MNSAAETFLADKTESLTLLQVGGPIDRLNITNYHCKQHTAAIITVMAAFDAQDMPVVNAHACLTFARKFR